MKPRLVVLLSGGGRSLQNLIDRVPLNGHTIVDTPEADYAARITPAAVIPMHTPAEAIEQLEFAVQELGLKAAMIAGFVERPIEDVAGGPHNVWWDLYGMESAHDYDPFWARCVELGVAPTSHSGPIGWGTRRSPSERKPYIRSSLSADS